ncbi:MAG: ANTAR domain-containing protein [Clostridiales bacterium]|nr:ANTAR domain-containing protein [Clostridiales bacterium]
MANVIVAFSRPEDARSIKNILTKNGFPVTAVCSSGAQALALTEDLSHGIIVCGYRLTDMVFSDLAENLSSDFSMLMVSSPHRWPSHVPENVILLPMPLKVHDLIESVDMIVRMQTRVRKKRRQQPKQRNEKEQTLIAEAKKLLMERNGLTEEEAHRYIQKSSMDSGTNMAETAQMLISLINI